MNGAASDNCVDINKYCTEMLFQDEETEALLSADFEIGHFFRERVIPKVELTWSLFKML